MRKLLYTDKTYEIIFNAVDPDDIPDPNFPIQDPGSRGQTGIGSRIRIHYTDYLTTD
jgi:hypothetical protein